MPKLLFVPVENPGAEVITHEMELANERAKAAFYQALADKLGEVLDKKKEALKHLAFNHRQSRKLNQENRSTLVQRYTDELEAIESDRSRQSETIACLQADKETILGDRGRQAAYIKSLQHDLKASDDANRALKLRVKQLEHELIRVEDQVLTKNWELSEQKDLVEQLQKQTNPMYIFPVDPVNLNHVSVLEDEVKALTHKVEVLEQQKLEYQKTIEDAVNRLRPLGNINPKMAAYVFEDAQQSEDDLPF